MDILSHFIETDIVLLKAVHRHHHIWLDALMSFWSFKWSWLPLYAVIIFLLIRKLGLKEGMLYLIFLAGAIAVSDQLSSSLIKPFFERLRPCHDPHLLPFLHLPDGCGGNFGFVSSHAANSICLLLFLQFRFHLSKSWLLLGCFWVFMTGFSRIYLGAHFPADILGGWLVGILSAFMVYPGFVWTRNKLHLGTT